MHLKHNSCRCLDGRAWPTPYAPNRYLFGVVRGHMPVTGIGADSTGATGNFAPVLTQEPGQTLRFAPVPVMAVL